MTPKEQLKIVGLLAIGILLVWGVLTTLLLPISAYPPELAEKIAMFYMAWLGFGGLCGGIIIVIVILYLKDPLGSSLIEYEGDKEK